MLSYAMLSPKLLHWLAVLLSKRQGSSCISDYCRVYINKLIYRESFDILLSMKDTCMAFAIYSPNQHMKLSAIVLYKILYLNQLHNNC